MCIFISFVKYRDINIQSPYCRGNQCESIEKWLPIFPELNFIILKGKENDCMTRNSSIVSHDIN